MDNNSFFALIEIYPHFNYEASLPIYQNFKENY